MTFSPFPNYYERPSDPPEKFLDKTATRIELGRGAGQKMSIRITDLEGLLWVIAEDRQRIGALEREAAAVVPAGEPVAPREPSSRSKLGQALARIEILEQIVAAFADGVEEHPELQGSAPAEFVDAWCRQAGVFPDGAPDLWLDVLTAALGSTDDAGAEPGDDDDEIRIDA